MNKKNLATAHLPALRCRMGDRGYFVTAMRFSEVADRVKDVAEVHSSKKLRDWIQRQLRHEHAAEISRYLINEESRFFNALVVGVYGGNAQWGPLNVRDARKQLSGTEQSRINETVGILTLSGKEKLFPIDGQHRLAGIKKAVVEEPDLGKEEVTVILVAHGRSEEGMKRTRRLFVTLNQRAKQVSPRDIVALDEDNGLAIVTRRMIDDYDLFQTEGIISFSGAVSILESDKKAITSVLGLYQIVKALYPRSGTEWPKLKSVQRQRPDNLDEMYDFNTEYWASLIKVVPEYKTVLRDKKRPASHFRQRLRNHLLFRPVGQLAFARAVEYLIANGRSLYKAIELLHSKNEMDLENTAWHHVLWNPVAEKMLNNWSPAEALLLITAGEQARSRAAEERLRRLQRGAETVG
jgi:DNA sulfur modification protein DndB